jgi:hypothetical protein
MKNAIMSLTLSLMMMFSVMYGATHRKLTLYTFLETERLDKSKAKKLKVNTKSATQLTKR